MCLKCGIQTRKRLDINNKRNHKMLQKINSKQGGFTLVEIMIVVAIIALLAAIAVPNFLRSRRRAQATQEIGRASCRERVCT